MDADGFLELLNILSATLSEGSLSLSVALFAFFRSGIDRLAATLSLGLLAVLGDVDDGTAAAGSHGRVLVSLRGGTSRLFALVPVMRVRRLGVDGHLVGHAFELALGDDSRAAASAPVILTTQNSVL